MNNSTTLPPPSQQQRRTSVLIDTFALDHQQQQQQHYGSDSFVHVGERRKKSLASEEYKSSMEGSNLYGSSFFSDKSSSMVQEQIFLFMHMFRVKPHWLFYNVYLLIFTVQSLPLLFPPQNWGHVFTRVFDYFSLLRTLGLQFAPYITFEILTGIAAGVYVLVLALFFLSYRYYSQGDTWFAKMKSFVLLSMTACSFISLTWMYVFTSFWDCDTNARFLTRHTSINCASGRNLGWGIASLFVMLVQLFITTFLSYCICVTAPGKENSFFALDTMYFFIWEQFSILLVAMLRIVVIWVPYIRGLFASIQALLSLVLLFALLPFFRRRANSLYAGLSTGRLLASLISFAGGVSNMKNDNLLGIIFGSVAPAAFVVGFIVGFVAMEMYTAFILDQVGRYEKRVRTKKVDHISPFFIDVFLRFNLHDDNVREHAFKLVDLCSLYSIESCKLFITQGIYFTYFSTTHIHMASKCLRRCFSFRPNALTKFLILNRFKDLEREIGDDNDNQKLFQFITQGKKKQVDYFHYVKGFWRHLLSEKVSYNKLTYFVTKAEGCAQDASRIYNNMMGLFNKRPDALRAYAEFLLEVEWDRDAATYYWDSADTLEEQEQLRERLRKKFYDNAETNLTPELENIELPEIDRPETDVAEHSELPENADIVDVMPNVEIPIEVINTNAQVQQSQIRSPRLEAPLDPKPPLLNERRRNRLFDTHYTARKSIEEDEDLQSAEELRDTNQRRQEIMHKLISKQDSQWISRIVLLSVTLVFLIYLSVMLIIGTRGVKILDTRTILTACRLHSLPVETLTLWRQGQANMGANATLDSSYSSSIRSLMTIKLQNLLDGVIEGRDLGFARGHREKLLKDRFELLVPVVNRNTSYLSNQSLADATDILFSNNQEVTDGNFLSTVLSFPFMFLWNNRLRISDSFWDYCQIFRLDYNRNDQEQIRPIIAMAIVSGIFHFAFIIVLYLPTFILFVKKQRDVLGLFKMFPREVLGTVFQDIQARHRKDSDRIRTSKILISSKGKIFVCFLLVLAVDIAAVTLIFYDITSAVYGKDGISSVVVDSGRVMKNINRIAFQLGEGVCRFNCITDSNAQATDPVVLRQLISEAREFYANWKYGDADKFGKGIVGRSGRIERLIREDVCYFGPSSSLDPYRYYCKSLDSLMEDALLRIPILRVGAVSMDTQSVVDELNHIYFMINAITEKLEYATDIFTSNIKTGFELSIVYIYLILFAVLVVVTVPNYYAVTGEVSINREIRKMFNFVPAEFIDAVPEIRQYIHTYKAKSKFKARNRSGKTKAILDASNDAVIICNDHGVIIQVNAMAREMFQIEDTDVIGNGLETMFKEHEEVRFDVLELLKSKRGILKEYTAKRKTGSEFPSKLSMSVGFLSKKTVIAAFVRDCTIEFKQTQLIQQEKKHSDQLLLNILPAPVAVRLKRGETHISDTIDDATCFFSDMVGFTKMSSTMTASRLVELLNDIVNTFDDLCSYHGLEKIKTIGDAYFCVGGLHNASSDHPERVIRFGLDIIKSVSKYNGEIQLRCGCHTGSIVAGVIGKMKFAYDVWGDSVNLASRMEGTGIPGSLQCSRSTYERVHDLFDFKERPDVEIKGKGKMTTYIVLAEKEAKRRTDMRKATFAFPDPATLVFRRYSTADVVDNADVIGSARANYDEDALSTDSGSLLTEESLKKHNEVTLTHPHNNK